MCGREPGIPPVPSPFPATGAPWAAAPGASVSVPTHGPPGLWAVASHKWPTPLLLAVDGVCLGRRGATRQMGGGGGLRKHMIVHSCALWGFGHHGHNFATTDLALLPRLALCLLLCVFNFVTAVCVFSAVDNFLQTPGVTPEFDHDDVALSLMMVTVMRNQMQQTKKRPFVEEGDSCPDGPGEGVLHCSASSLIFFTCIILHCRTRGTDLHPPPPPLRRLVLVHSTRQTAFLARWLPAIRVGPPGTRQKALRGDKVQTVGAHGTPIRGLPL